MDASIKREICILLCHYLKQKNPEIYKELARFVEAQNFLPVGCDSIDEALNLRFQSFSPDQFHEFIKSLRPKDDFPSIFRRIAPFEQPPVQTVEMAAIRRVYVHRKEIYCLAIDPLARIIVTASDDCSIKVWAVPSIDPICRFVGHEAVVTNISLNPLCSMILSSSEDKTIRLWSLETGKCISVLGGFTSEIVNYAVFSPTGSMIAAACEDGTIPIWTTVDAIQCRPPIKTLRSPIKSAVTWLTFSPGSEFLAFSGEPNTIVVTALKSLTSSQLELHQCLADNIYFSQRYTSIGGELGPRLLSVSNMDGAAAIWCIDNGQWKPKFVFRHHTGQGRKSSKINRIAWDCEEHLLVIAKHNVVFVCDSINGETIGTISSTAAAFENTTCVVGNPVKRELFFVANKSGACCLIDIFQLNVLCEFRAADDADFSDAVWGKDGEYLYAVDLAGAITVFKTCPSKNDIEVRFFECFNSEDFGRTDENLFCDRNGVPLQSQPFLHDIRLFGIPLQVEQTPMLRNSAIEIGLIQRLIRNERPPTPTSQAAAIGPPPLHIRLSTEYPVNPHGKSAFKLLSDPEGTDEETTNFRIESEAEDWYFTDNFDPQEGEIEENRPTLMLSKDVPEGFYPKWSYAFAYDEDLYIPQYGDNCIFYKDVYLDFIKEKVKNNPSFTNILKHIIELNYHISHPKKSNEPINIDFNLINDGDGFNNFIQKYFPEFDGDQVQNRSSVIDTQAADNEMLILISYGNTKFWTFFPLSEVQTYIILLSKFKISLENMKILTIGDKIEFKKWNDQGIINFITAKVSEIKENYQSHLCNSIIVEVGDKKEEISPWDITKVNDQKIKTSDQAILFSAYIRGMQSTLEKYMNDPNYNDIIHCLDPRNPLVLEKVKLPISLTLIRERLESNWYRSFPGLNNDFKLLEKNTIAFYGIDSPQTAFALSLRQSILDSIEQIKRKALERSDNRPPQLAMQQNQPKTG